MWEFPPKQQEESKETAFFIDWIDRWVLSEDVQKQANDLFLEIEQEVGDPIKLFRLTPQSAPWHAEGPTLFDHIHRILCGIFAVTQGAEILRIEELVRDKSFQGEYLELERVIRENAGTLFAFAFTHDLAKRETLTFDAPKGSKGEREGFSKQKYRNREVASDEQCQFYLKMLRAFKERNGIESDAELMGRFYDEFEIKVHYYGHDRKGAGSAYKEIRQQIAGMFHLSVDDAAMLQLLVKSHIDVILFFKEKPDIAKYRTLLERANKHGFDGDDFMDLLFASLFLDSAVGSLVYKDGEFFPQLNSVQNFIASEFEARPDRRMKRKEQAELHERKRVKAVLQAAGLLKDDVFSILNVPFGPKRGEVMKKIRQAVRDESEETGFSEVPEIDRRIREARNILTSGR